MLDFIDFPYFWNTVGVTTNSFFPQRTSKVNYLQFWYKILINYSWIRISLNEVKTYLCWQEMIGYNASQWFIWNGGEVLCWRPRVTVLWQTWESSKLFSGAESGVQNMIVSPHPFEAMRPENIRVLLKTENWSSILWSFSSCRITKSNENILVKLNVAWNEWLCVILIL